MERSLLLIGDVTLPCFYHCFFSLFKFVLETSNLKTSSVIEEIVLSNSSAVFKGITFLVIYLFLLKTQ